MIVYVEEMLALAYAERDALQAERDTLTRLFLAERTAHRADIDYLQDELRDSEIERERNETRLNELRALIVSALMDEDG